MSQPGNLKVFQDPGSFLAISLDVNQAHVNHLPDYLRPRETQEHKGDRGVCGNCELPAQSSTKREGVCRAGRGREPYCEKQGWDWGAALHVDHGQHTGKVALPGSSKEQPGREKSRSACDGPWTIPGCFLPSPAPLSMPTSAHTGASPLQPGTCLLVHTFQPTSQMTHVHKAGAGKPEAVSG